MNAKQSKQIRKSVKKNENKIIADFVTGENKDLIIIYAIDNIKKFHLLNRIKIAMSILRGAKK